jgi:hypothetical protein
VTQIVTSPPESYCFQQKPAIPEISLNSQGLFFLQVAYSSCDAHSEMFQTTDTALQILSKHNSKKKKEQKTTNKEANKQRPFLSRSGIPQQAAIMISGNPDWRC